MDHAITRIEQVYRAHAARCVGYARALCPDDPHAAEDVVHDVFVRLAERPGLPEGDEGVGFLLTCVRNAALNRRRDQGRRARLEQAAGQQRPWFAAPDGGAADWEVERWLDALPAEQREVVYLHVWAGRTFAQIAELAGTSANTVASRFRYAVQALRTFAGATP